MIAKILWSVEKFWNDVRRNAGSSPTECETLNGVRHCAGTLAFARMTCHCEGMRRVRTSIH
jgi:hypothetical protein